jgi:O-antigen ligase
LLSMGLFTVYFLLAVFVFQRGTFLCFALACLLVFVAARGHDRAGLLKRIVVRGAIVAVLGIFVAPYVFQYLTGSRYGRFLVTPENILRFMYSIVSSDVDIAGGVAGTRHHRLEMWTAITGLVFSSIKSTLFGFGYGGEVGDALGVSFRAPHNGLITILYRSGMIGVLLLVGLFGALFRVFARGLRWARLDSPWRWHAATGLIILGALLGDALTGTILDSPFTGMLFYVHAGILAVLINRQMSHAATTDDTIRSEHQVSSTGHVVPLDIR